MSKSQGVKQKSANQVNPFVDKEKELLATIEEKCEKNALDNTSSIKIPYQAGSLRWEDRLAEVINYQGSTGCVAVINDENSKELIIIDEKNYLSNSNKSESVRVFLSELQDSSKGEDDLKKSLSNICEDAMQYDLVLNDELQTMIQAGVISKEANLYDRHKELLKYLTEEYGRYGTQQEQQEITKECQKISNSFTEQDKQDKRTKNFRTAVDLERKVKQYITGRDMKANKLDRLLENRNKLKGYTVKYLDDPNKKYSWNKPSMHPDVKAIEYLRDEDKLEKQQVYYIGITMPPCVPCEISIRAINKENEDKGQIATRQTDGKYFPNWSRFAHLEDNPKNHESFKNFIKEAEECEKDPEQYFSVLRPSFQDLKSMQATHQEIESKRNTIPAVKEGEKNTVTTIFKKGQPPQTKTATEPTTSDKDELSNGDVNNEQQDKAKKEKNSFEKKKGILPKPIKQKISSTEKAINATKLEIVKLEKTYSSLKDKAKHLEAEKKRLENELPKCMSKLQEATKQMQDKLNKSDINVKEAVQYISDVQYNIQHSFGDANKNQELLSSWNNALESRMKQETSLQGEQKSLTKQNNAILRNIRKNIDDLTQDIITTEKDIKTKEEAIETNNKKLSNLNSSLHEYQKTINDQKIERDAKDKALQNKISNESQEQHKIPKSQTSQSSSSSTADHESTNVNTTTTTTTTTTTQAKPDAAEKNKTSTADQEKPATPKSQTSEAPEPSSNSPENLVPIPPNLMQQVKDIASESGLKDHMSNTSSNKTLTTPNSPQATPRSRSSTPPKSPRL